MNESKLVLILISTLLILTPAEAVAEIQEGVKIRNQVSNVTLKNDIYSIIRVYTNQILFKDSNLSSYFVGTSGKVPINLYKYNTSIEEGVWANFSTRLDSVNNVNFTFSNLEGRHVIKNDSDYLKHVVNPPTGLVFFNYFDWGRTNYLSIIKDLSDPSVSYVPPTPEDGSRQIQNQVTVNATVSDLESGISNCVLQWGGSNETFQPSNGYCSITKSTLDGRSYGFRMFVNNSVNLYAGEPRRVFIENNKSSLSLIYPRNNSYYFEKIGALPGVKHQSTFNFTLSDSESDLMNVTVYESGSLIGEDKNVQSGSYALISYSFAEEYTQHDLVVNITDSYETVSIPLKIRLPAYDPNGDGETTYSEYNAAWSNKGKLVGDLNEANKPIDVDEDGEIDVTDYSTLYNEWSG